jgi:adenine phosphoribosyltransferase
MLERVELYRGQESHKVCVAGIIRYLPLVQVDEGLWIASNGGIIFGDIEFISAAARAIVERLKPLKPDIIVTPEAKAIAFAYEVAKSLGHKRLVVARKSIKAYMKDYLVEEVKSITTRERQIMILTKEDVGEVSGKRVCILDDVVSTGGTINALEKLVKRAGEDRYARRQYG